MVIVYQYSKPEITRCFTSDNAEKFAKRYAEMISQQSPGLFTYMAKPFKAITGTNYTHKWEDIGDDGKANNKG